MDEQRLEEWDFHFGLCAQEAGVIPESKCDELLDMIIDWAEKHGYGVGGGFRPFPDIDP